MAEDASALDHGRVVEAVFDTVAATAPEIRAALPGRRVESGAENPSGESVLAADEYADDLLAERLADVDGVGTYASEERPDPIDFGEGLSVAVDPLDGSSNLKSNNAMGTVVGVYDGALPAPGTALVGAGFVLYGPITTMVVATEAGVREEVIGSGADMAAADGATGADATTGADADVSREVVTPDLTLPERPTVYGFGGRVPDWPDDFRAFVRGVEKDLKLRYGGAMVGDVNQVLTYGGIFAYPALSDAPDGKLRLQFEANPIAYVVEKAGGSSSDGDQSILEVPATDLHERVPLHVGNAALIDRLEASLG